MTRISTSEQAAVVAASSIFQNPEVEIIINEELVGTSGIGNSDTFTTGATTSDVYFASVNLTSGQAYDFIVTAVTGVDYDLKIFDSAGFELQVSHEAINTTLQSTDDNTEINAFSADATDTYYIQVTIEHSSVATYDFNLTVTEDVQGQTADLTGGDTNDQIIGGTSSDDVSGGGGDDTLAGGSGGDTIEGGSGSDVISGDSGSGSSSSSSSSSAGSGGSSGGSSSSSSGGGSSSGGTGAVTSVGTSTVDGNDLIYGGVGDDEIYGNGGNDTIYGDDGDDTLDGGVGTDEVRGLNGNDLIYLGADDDVFANGNQGNDTLYGGAGNDARMLGGKDADFVYGQDGNDFVNGNKGNDSVYGDNGNDTVHGGTAEDQIFGLAGDDFLYGDLGNDTISGGTGADVFVFSTDSGVDVIADFVLGEDKIQVKSTVLATAADVVANFSNGVLDLGDGNTVTITGLSSLSASDVIIF